MKVKFKALLIYADKQAVATQKLVRTYGHAKPKIEILYVCWKADAKIVTASANCLLCFIDIYDAHDCTYAFSSFRSCVTPRNATTPSHVPPTNAVFSSVASS